MWRIASVTSAGWRGSIISASVSFYDVTPDAMAIGLENVTRYPYLFCELLRRGYSDDVVRKSWGEITEAMRQMEAQWRPNFRRLRNL